MAFNIIRSVRDLGPAPANSLQAGMFQNGEDCKIRADMLTSTSFRLLYTALVRLLSSFKIVASETEPPNTDYVEYNQFKSALVAIPRDFKVKLIPRDPDTLEECLKAAEERTKDAYT